jgi:hypothetical protein
MSEQSLPKSPELIDRARKAGLARWKLETLTGLLGVRSLQHHQRESEKNQAAENRAARIGLWGSKERFEESDDMGGHTILGDVTHPTPVIIAGQQQQGSGLGKVLAGAALAAGLIGIPGAGLAGYFLSKLTDKPAATQPGTDDTVDIGLKRFSELVGGAK